mgnify:CR=1 FL=1
MKVIVFDVNNEEIRLSNIKPENSDLETDLARAKNKAKLLVLRQLFGYDCIQGIIDGALRE